MTDSKIRVIEKAFYLIPAKPSTTEHIFFDTYRDIPLESHVEIIHKSKVDTQYNPKIMKYVKQENAEHFMTGTLKSRNSNFINGSGYGRNEDITYVVNCPQLNKNITWTINSQKADHEYYFKLELNPEFTSGGRGKRLTSKHLKRTHMKRTHMKRTHMKRTHMKSKHRKSKNKRSKCTGRRR